MKRIFNKMETNYKNIVTANGNKAISFDITTNKGDASGLFTDNTIFVHLISGSVKGIINILINKFKTNKITFTPLVNDNIKNSIRGNIKVMKADDVRNPYKEDFEYMECLWKK